MKPPTLTELITEFNHVTYNTDNDVATKYLTQSNGNVIQAIQEYFEEQESRSSISSNPSTDVIRVLIVGSTGAGKSSLINGVAGSTLSISDSANGCTAESSRVNCTYENVNYQFLDTAGLGEVTEVGTVRPDVAFKAILKLIRYSYAGYNLVVFVTAKKKICQSDVDHVKLITEILCKNSIPTVLLINKSESGAKKIEDIYQNKWLNDNDGANLKEFHNAFGKDTFQFIQQIAFPKGEKDITKKIREASRKIFFEKVLKYASPTRIVMKHTATQFLSDCFKHETGNVDGSAEHNFFIGLVMLPLLPLALLVERIDKSATNKQESKKAEEEHANLLSSTLTVSRKEALELSKETAKYEFSELGAGQWE